MTEYSKHNGGLDREFIGLLWDLCEEQLTEPATARLNELLLTDRNRRRALVEFMQMAAGLEWEHSGLGGKAPETVARAWCSFDSAGLCGTDLPPSTVEGLGGLTALFAGISDRPAGQRTIAQPTTRRKSSLIFSLANWLQPRRVVSISRAAAAVLLMGTLMLGMLGAAAVTMGMMKSDAQAGHGVVNHVLGSRCIGRANRDTTTGTVCFMCDPTTVSGRAVSFSFYNVHSDNDRWITPIILALDRTTGTYRITGIGQSVLNLGSGLQTVPFQLIVGSADLESRVHTFGFYHGTVDKTGKATSASLGPLDFDRVPEPMDPSDPLAGEPGWLYVASGPSTPVPLRLDLEFNLDPFTGQVSLWRGNETYPRERVYSGQLEIVAESEVPGATDTVGTLRARALFPSVSSRGRLDYGRSITTSFVGDHT